MVLVLNYLLQLNYRWNNITLMSIKTMDANAK